MYEYKFWWCQKYNQTRLLQQTFKVKKIEIALKINSRPSKQDQEKDKALEYLLNESHLLISFCLKHIVSSKSKHW